MSESASKNTIIIILSIIVIGLAIIIYTQHNEQPLVTPHNDPSREVDEGMGGAEDTVVGKKNLEVDEEKSTKTPTVMPKTNTTPITKTPKKTTSNSEEDITRAIVTYTNAGFIPPVAEIRQGESITFINSSNKPMWVTADAHPTAKDQNYPEFNQGRSVPIGGSYTFLFSRVGVWGYKNLNFDTHLGAISVIAQ